MDEPLAMEALHGAGRIDVFDVHVCGGLILRVLQLLVSFGVFVSSSLPGGAAGDTSLTLDVARLPSAAGLC